ncbi:hypothetical protein G6O69_19335 [Pseudenhygromyxa sp. WMMC2535]|uniref:glycosyl hydrolase family 28-related protein n=1 Tax=Pseudenhygromyxa sp. WMMC2535 TaxID=2712867 RepID=UPI001595777B|nr:glycosyl hydrolase family 28-related protein [Pseudenhygromyxa sp. WMMC2535]NVB40007.1 hypothetical protein [Pseudenhygromyxa sp. WMMC2535]
MTATFALALVACSGSSETDAGAVDVGSESSSDTDEVGTGTGGDTDSGTGTDADSGTDSDSDTGEESWRSVLYPEDWTPELVDEDGRFLHDFSYAGYHGGVLPLPEQIPGVERSVLDDGADPTGAEDSTAAIQASIDFVGEAGGGVVWLPPGSYRCDGLLTVAHAGVVIRGAGPETSLWFTRTAEMNGQEHLSFRGQLVQGAELALLEDGAPRSETVRVGADAGDALALGDDLAIGWVITDEFVDEHEMAGMWASFNGQWRTFFRRELVAMDCDAAGCTLTLDVPLRYPAKLRDQASVRVETGYLEEVGLEHLRLSTVSADWDAAWTNPRSHAAAMIAVKDSWMRGLSSFESPNSSDDRQRHLMSGGLFVSDAKRVTVADSTMAWPQHRGTGGAGYLFEISRSSEIMTRDSVASGGRHNFIQNWDFGTSGCVWLRVESEAGAAFVDSTESVPLPGYSDFHHSLAMANLIDGARIDDGWHAVNRTGFSSGAGHSATQNVFWAVSGAGVLRSFQWGWGYIIGSHGLSIERELDEGMLFESLYTAPEDWLEGAEVAASLEPASLYEDQLARRLSP